MWCNHYQCLLWSSHYFKSNELCRSQPLSHLREFCLSDDVQIEVPLKSIQHPIILHLRGPPGFRLFCRQGKWASFLKCLCVAGVYSEIVGIRCPSTCLMRVWWEHHSRPHTVHPSWQVSDAPGAKPTHFTRIKGEKTEKKRTVCTTVGLVEVIMWTFSEDFCLVRDNEVL